VSGPTSCAIVQDDFFVLKSYLFFPAEAQLIHKNKTEINIRAHLNILFFSDIPASVFKFTAKLIINLNNQLRGYVAPEEIVNHPCLHLLTALLPDRQRR
jgi:hypothetical protein